MLPTQPPAHVHQHFDREAALAEVKEADISGRAAGEKSVQHFLFAGQRLQQIKESLGHGEWTPYRTANLTTIGERQIQYYLRLASAVKEKPNADLGGLWDEIRGRVKEKHSPYPPEKRCRDCRLNNRDKPNCRKCHEHNREPGEDRPTRKIEFDWPDWKKHFGYVVRGVDAFAKTKKLATSPEYHGLRRKLKEFFDEFRQVMKKLDKEA